MSDPVVPTPMQNCRGCIEKPSPNEYRPKKVNYLADRNTEVVMKEAAKFEAEVARQLEIMRRGL